MRATEQRLLQQLMVVLGLTVACHAQGLIQLRGPDTGFLYDPPTRSLRSIAGLIGAARVGEPVVEGIEWASVGPSGWSALYGKGGTLFVLSAQKEPVAIAGLEGEGPDEVFWSTDSRQALLVWTRGKRVQRITIDAAGVASAGETQRLEVEGEITTAAWTGPGPLVVAVAGTGVHAVNLETAVARLLLPIPNCKALGFSADGSAAWAVDAQHGVLSRIALDGEEQPTVFLADPERLSEVTRVSPAPNGRDLLLANSQTRRLYVLRADERALAEQAVLDGPATQLRPMGRSSLYLLGHRTTAMESVQLYDDLRGETVFVPFPGGNQ